MSADGLTIPGDLVRYLRQGVKADLIATLEILKIRLDTTVNPGTYRQALACFDEDRSLLDTIGLADEPRQQSIQLDLSRYPRITIKALQEQHRLELLRLETAAIEGFEPPTNNALALSALIEQIGAKA
jgi:hypothetical protein